MQIGRVIAGELLVLSICAATIGCKSSVTAKSDGSPAGQASGGETDQADAADIDSGDDGVDEGDTGDDDTGEDGSGDGEPDPEPAATLEFGDQAGFQLGTMVHGSTRTVTLPIQYDGNTPVTSVTLKNQPGVAFKGGSFPGTGGTCSLPLKKNCSVTVDVAAGTEVAVRSIPLELTYKSAAGSKALTAELQATTKFLWGETAFDAASYVPFSVDGAGAWTNGTKLLVASWAAHRILGWNTFPASAAVPPDFVLGSPDPAQVGDTGTTALTCRNPMDVTSDGVFVAVSCFGQNRVLIWNQWPSGSGVAADVVVGQPDFVTATADTGGISGATLEGPRGLHVAGGNLYIADSRNHRVLIFNGIPSSNGEAADRVIGQADMDDSGAAVSASRLSFPTDMVVAGGRLYISEFGNNRVVSHPTAYPANGASADVVIGHALMTESAVNDGGAASALTLNRPTHIDSDGTSLFVVDQPNHRVLRFNPLPTTSQPAAIQVYGQPDFATVADDDGAVTSGSLDLPNGVAAGGGKLVLTSRLNARFNVFNSATNGNFPSADMIWGQSSPTSEFYFGVRESATQCQHPSSLRTSTHFHLSCLYGHRVLAWVGMPVSPTDPPDFVIGQADFTAALPNAGGAVGAGTLNLPRNLAAHGADLWVPDMSNNRILKFAAPSANAPPATLVVGQADFVSNAADRGGAAAANTLDGPMDISIAGSKFVVADYRNNRVLLFNAIPTAVDAAADFVLGQANFTGTSANRGAAVAANTLNLPGSVWTDGARIAVADSANNRVLLWNAWPTASGAPADIVLGQLDFAGAAINRGSPTTIANGMYEPSIVRFVDGKLYVADRFNNRILVWNDWPTANGQIPDRYLLQDDATSSLYGRGESGFSDINFFEIVGDALFVTDRLNFRYVGMPMPQ